MSNLQCISCNSPIFDAAKSCKCGHVNEAMRTIAGKRFSGYREELYTRRVIKESRDEYRRMKRESLGMRTRPRKSSAPEKLRLRRKRQTLDDMCPITDDTHHQLNAGLNYDHRTDNKPYTNGHHGNHTNIHLQDMQADETNQTNTQDVASLRDCDLENDVYDDSSLGYGHEYPANDSYVIQHNYKQYVPKTKTIPPKRGPKKTAFHHHYNRKTGVVCRENKTAISRPIKQFAIAGPLAEINKRLMNQSGLWMCLSDSLGFSKPALAATDIKLKDVL